MELKTRRSKVLYVSVICLFSALVILGAYLALFDGSQEKDAPPADLPSPGITSVTVPALSGEPFSVRATGEPGKAYHVVLTVEGRTGRTFLESLTAPADGVLSWEWTEDLLPIPPGAELTVTLSDGENEASITLRIGQRQPDPPPETDGTDEANGLPSEDETGSAPVEIPGGGTYAGLRVSAITPSPHPGGNVALSLRGKPDTEYEIVVRYKSVSRAKGIESKMSDDKGDVSWVWRIGPSVQPGTYTVTVTGGDEEIVIPLIIE